jgi:hypothetical protein
VWSKELTTDRTHQRRVEYDFPIKPIVEAKQQQLAGLEVRSVPVALRVSVSVLAGDKDRRNNEAPLRFRAVAARQRALLIDGRPRWDFRYLRNLLERDHLWEVTALLAPDVTAQFPATKEALFAYDIIGLGDVPAENLTPTQQEWIREFVGTRGGGLLLMDGRREALRAYRSGALGPLLPVQWVPGATEVTPQRFQLTGPGAKLGAFRLGSGDESDNAAAWKKLAPPHWLAPVKALPGTETLVETVAGNEARPAVVLRQFGAGKVLYFGFDESWRWRYEVAGQYQDPFWNQVVNWIMEPPFAVRDQQVALDVDKVTYQPGERAEIRARFRDEAGKPVTPPNAKAWLYRDGQRVASVELTADEGGSGVFRGKTGALGEGAYEIGASAGGLTHEESQARLAFYAQARDAGEMIEQNCNEELLRQIATQSGGEYFREEDVGRLVDRLAPFSHGRVVESDTVLWQSWWWFVPLVLMLAAEWILRKRAGLI